MRLRFAMACLALALAGPAAAEAPSVKAGVEAWQRGDQAAATAIWRALAEKGDADAAFNLGQAYRLGRGVPADSAMAKRWFEMAANKGHLDAQVSLGLLLFDSGDRPIAMDWLKKAAAKGEPRALLVVGTALFNGDSIRQDPILGYAYVSRAAAQGLGPAKTTLADMDKVLSLEERKRGVALALDLVKTPAPAIAKPKPAVNATKPAPATARPAITSATPPAARGAWRIQLGAFSTRASAEGLFRKLSASPALGGRQAFYVAVGKITRLQAGPFESRSAAAAACAKLAPQPCFTVEAR